MMMCCSNSKDCMSTSPSTSFEKKSSGRIGSRDDRDLFMIDVHSSFGSFDDSMPPLGRLSTLSTIHEEKRRHRPRGAHHRSCSSAGDVDKLAKDFQRQLSTTSTVDLNDDDDYEEDYEEYEDEDEEEGCVSSTEVEDGDMKVQDETREEQLCVRRGDRDSRSSPSSSPTSVMGRSKFQGLQMPRRLSPSSSAFFGVHESDVDECDTFIRKESSPETEAALERSSQSLQDSVLPPPPPPSSPALGVSGSRRTYSDPTLKNTLPSAMAMLLEATASDSLEDKEQPHSQEQHPHSPTTRQRKHRRQRSMDWSQPLDLSS